jgi:hypothetical protein
VIVIAFYAAARAGVMTHPLHGFGRLCPKIHEVTQIPNFIRFLGMCTATVPP